MNKDLFSLLGWNNIFDVNTNSDHVPQREINGRDIYFLQECPDLRPILRHIPIYWQAQAESQSLLNPKEKGEFGLWAVTKIS